MALTGQSTPYLNLYKPALTDSPPDITSANPNWDAVDEELSRLNENGLPPNIKNKLPSAVTPMEVKQIYMSPTGDDTADGSAERPLKTIATAIARFGGMVRLILLFNAGTYTETNSIEVSGCAGVEFVAVEGASVTIKAHYYQYGGYFNANNISFTSDSADVRNTLTFYCVGVTIEDCTFTVKNYAISFRNGSQGVVTRCTFTNCECALYATNGSMIGAHNIYGGGNVYGFSSTASVITVGTSTLTATTLATKAGGGVIFRNGNLIGSTANTFVNAT